MFLCTEDDPIIGKACIEYEICNGNENCFLATTKYGGHLGYFESFVGSEQWFIKPVFAFLEAYK
jgi:predicted alpha/beta-fold hydrolase